MIKTTAEVKVKDNAGKVIAQQSYQKTVFEYMKTDEKGNGVKLEGDAVSDALSAAIQHYQSENPKGNGVVDLLRDATYAYDLGKRAAIRNSLVTAAAGPDKAIDKAIKDLMAARAAAGKPLTEAQAREKVMVMMAD